MSSARLLQDQLCQAHEFLDGTMDGVTDEQLHWQPEGFANPLGATYAHLVLGEDAFVSALAGARPLFEDGRADRVGVSELPPMAEPGALVRLEPEWHDWARSVRVDLPVLREYAAAVHATSDRYLGSLDDQDLDQMIDLSGVGFGQQSLAWILSEGLVGHVRAHWGEIACLKGMQRGKGFPR
ncbi:MAG: DinB family protein [Thermomicrobiales bacterium]